MNRQLSSLIFAATAAISSPAHSQASNGKPAAPAQTVEVNASTAAYDPRKDDTATKIVIGREEITKYGDTSVTDVLKRVPGITVSGAAGRGGEVRMRGLGSGYTQILINGERPPAGFTLDSLTPDVIERIEVLRAASAEFSTQSIAGTINIVLRKTVAKSQNEWKLGYAAGSGMHSPNLNVQLADRKDKMSYSVAIGANDNRFDRTSHSTEELLDPAGQLTASQVSTQHDKGSSKSVNAAPRVNWTLDNGDTLTSQSFVNLNRLTYRGEYREQESVGPAVTVPNWNNDVRNESELLRSDLTWNHKLGGSRKLDLKVGFNLSSSRTGVHRVGYAGGPLTFDSSEDIEVRSQDYTSTGKFSSPIGDGHSLALGWDAARGRGDTDRVRREAELAGGPPPVNSDEAFEVETSRVAVYGQDEWNATPQLSLYFGARWEGVRLHSGGNSFPAFRSSTSVFSPLGQLLYKLPDSQGDQVRLALTRTYKSPSLNDLTPRRSISPNNSPTEPNFAGNPALQPELATGIDASYEHYWTGGGFFSASVSARRITNFTRRDVHQESDGQWVSMPVNHGVANTRSIELELKLPAKSLAKTALNLDLRANVARNWSSVESVPGPNNRVDQQVPVTASFGLDYKAGALTAGGSFAFRSGGPVRISESQTAYQTARRDLEVYALWKFGPKMSLRFSVNNVLSQEWISETAFVNENGTRHRTTVYPGTRFARLTLETKF